MSTPPSPESAPVNPPPAATKPRPKALWIGGGVAALLIAGWAGDVVNRYQAADLHKRGQAAFLNNDWGAALDSLRQAAQTRPTDSDYRRDFDAMQDKWLRFLQESASTRTPEEVFQQLEGEPVRLAKLLTEPCSSQFRNFAARNQEQVKTRLIAALERANNLAIEGKFKEAYAEAEKLRPLAKVHPKFEESVDQIRIAEVRAGMTRAATAADNHEFAKAYAALDGVRANSKLLADDFASDEGSLHLTELNYVLAQAVETSERGEFNSALSQLDKGAKLAQQLGKLDWFNRVLEKELAKVDEERRAGLKPEARVAEARAAIERNIGSRSAQKLADALGSGSVHSAQNVLDEYAALTHRKFSVTAGELMNEHELPKFLEQLTALGLRPANEAKRANRADLIVVEALRKSFSAQDEVAQFLGRSYFEWANELGNSGALGLASYVLRQARAAGNPANPEMEQQAREVLAKNYKLTVHLPSTTAKADASVPVNDAGREAIREVLARTAGKWITVDDTQAEEGAGGFQLVTHFNLLPEEHGRQQYTWNVRYQSGTQVDNNPEYYRIANELQQAQNSYNELRQAAAQAQAQSEALASTNAFGALFSVATNAYSGAALQESANKVNALNSQLANTPSRLSTPIYAEEPIPVTTHSLNHAATFELAVMTGRETAGTAAWSANLRYVTREWPGGARSGTAGQQPALVDPPTVVDRLGKDLAEKMSAQPDTVLRPLIGAIAKHIEARTREASPLEQADISWAQVELWKEGGVAVDDTPRREVAVRRALGLPVANEAAAIRVAAARPAMNRNFENSLGMKFTPVAGTGELFSIWETRVQDFQAFATDANFSTSKATAVLSVGTDGWAVHGDSWKNPGFPQEPTHPVCGVTWRDATAFCAWLTNKERAAGVIGADQEYRLPTDAEWSIAAGLGSETGATPEQKNGRAAGFSWGLDWPPPPGAGNFAYFEAKDGNWPNWAVIEGGVGDGYARTAPVGQFSANRFGLYDVDGNAQEWCEDPFKGTGEVRTFRGACFAYSLQNLLSLSARGNATPDTGFTAVGFRVVLAPVRTKM